MSDIVQKLWGFCNTLRHDGVDYGDYIEQLTYLLFLKMADERGSRFPRGAVGTISTSMPARSSSTTTQRFCASSGTRGDYLGRSSHRQLRASIIP
jgi:hypothetical protein